MQRSGVFLNLDRSAGRRAAMEAALAAAGVDWVHRRAALDGAALDVPATCRLTPAEYGCYLSHLQAVEEAPAGDFRFVFEDDIEPSPQLPAFLGDAQLEALGQVDVVLLDAQVDCDSHVLAQLWRSVERHLEDPGAMLAGTVPRRVTGVDLADAGAVFRWGLQAYGVTPAGRERWLAVLREGLARGPVQPVDLLVGDALRSGRLRGVLLVPTLATPRLDSHGDSTIGAPGQGDTQALAAAIRRLLFAGPVEGLDAFVRPLLARARAGSRAEALLGRLLAELLAVEVREGMLSAGQRG